jgi:hypothetical protein
MKRQENSSRDSLGERSLEAKVDRKLYCGIPQVVSKEQTDWSCVGKRFAPFGDRGML